MKIFPSPVGVIYTGNVNDGLNKTIDELSASSLFIVADENTAALCVPKLKGIADNSHVIILKPGEQNKNLESCQSIWSALIANGADRNSIVLNVGGGMICDLGGFAASCYQRGIRFVHVPTTLLSMADAAIGGKLGIDYEGLKNYIGLVQVPAFIWIDSSFLTTLPRIEVISGLAEIVKHAIIGSSGLWKMLTGVTTVKDIQWDKILDLNIPVKVRIVESDLKEQGLRKILNFGHTIGHAIESYGLASGQSLTHGQCVALGMLVESKMAAVLGLLNDVDFEAIRDLIIRLLEPQLSFLPDYQLLRPWVLRDKKKSGSRVGYSLPDGIGSCRWDVPVEEVVVVECFEWWKAQVKSVPFRLSADS